MSDPPIEPVPIRFVRNVVHTVDAWPAYTALTEDFLRQAHLYGATVEDDTVTFNVGNGSATYQLRRDLPPHGRGIIAEKVEGSTPSQLARSAQKFAPKD